MKARTSGYTLIELLVAMSMAGLVATIVALVLRSGTGQYWARMREADSTRAIFLRSTSARAPIVKWDSLRHLDADEMNLRHRADNGR